MVMLSDLDIEPFDTNGNLLHDPDPFLVGGVSMVHSMEEVKSFLLVNDLLVIEDQ